MEVAKSSSNATRSRALFIFAITLLVVVTVAAVGIIVYVLLRAHNGLQGTGISSSPITMDDKQIQRLRKRYGKQSDLTGPSSLRYRP